MIELIGGNDHAGVFFFISRPGSGRASRDNTSKRATHHSASNALVGSPSTSPSSPFSWQRSAFRPTLTGWVRAGPQTSQTVPHSEVDLAG